MKSIMPFDTVGKCYTCGASCHTETHHVFQGANRKESDNGLTVQLCRVCHARAHQQPEPFEQKHHLKSRAQAVAMDRFDWDIDEWRKHFRKDYRE